MRLLGVMVAAAAFAFGGCATSQPTYNVVNAPIVGPAGRNVSMNDVQTAIQRAGVSLGWMMYPEGPGRLSGRLAMRAHLAVVDIEHDTKTYSIKYRDSSNLKAVDGMIHKSYNEWVNALERAIRTQLQVL